MRLVSKLFAHFIMAAGTSFVRFTPHLLRSLSNWDVLRIRLVLRMRKLFVILFYEGVELGRHLAAQDSLAKPATGMHKIHVHLTKQGL